MKRLLLVAMVIVFYLLHQDFWNWRATYPLVFGFLPIGLFYHVSYTLAVTLLIWLLVKYEWPSYLEGRAGDERDFARSPALPLARSPNPEVKSSNGEDPHS